MSDSYKNMEREISRCDVIERMVRNFTLLVLFLAFAALSVLLILTPWIVTSFVSYYKFGTNLGDSLSFGLYVEFLIVIPSIIITILYKFSSYELREESREREQTQTQLNRHHHHQQQQQQIEGSYQLPINTEQ